MAARKPTIVTAGFTPEISKALEPVKQSVEMITGARAGFKEILGLPTNTSARATLSKINEIIERINASGTCTYQRDSAESPFSDSGVQPEDLTFLPLAGGTLTGPVYSTYSGNNFVVSADGSTNKMALQSISSGRGLYDISSGKWIVKVNSSGVTTVDGHLPLTGGTLTGSLTVDDTVTVNDAFTVDSTVSVSESIIGSNASSMSMYSDSGTGRGGALYLYPNSDGKFQLQANGSTQSSTLEGTPDGELTWGGIDVITGPTKAGNANKVLAVKSDETGTEWVTVDNQMSWTATRAQPQPIIGTVTYTTTIGKLIVAFGVNTNPNDNDDPSVSFVSGVSSAGIYTSQSTYLIGVATSTSVTIKFEDCNYMYVAY